MSGELDLKLMQAAALLDSDPAAAARAAEAILAAHPGHEPAILLLGAARRGAGDLEGARDSFSALADARPGSALIELELGRTLAAQGRAAEARAALERAVARAPALAPAWRELSQLEAQRGELLACDRAYARYSALVNEDAHLAEAAAALAHERLSRAEALLERALRADANDVAALRLYGEVAAAREDFPRAERLLRRSLELAPGYTRARAELARILLEQQKASEMQPLLARLLALEPASQRYRSWQAAALTLLGQDERALELLQGLLRDYPDSEWVWLHYGHVLRGCGRTAQAIEAYRRCTQLRPGFGEAWYSLANLKTLRFSAADGAAMRAQLERSDLGAEDRMQFEFALGKAREDEHDYAESFAHYARGNALRRAAVLYDADSTSALVRRTQTLFSAEFLAARRGWGDPAWDPIFILGLPRSGSTLIEQILASHSQVEGTRELYDVRALALELGLRDEPGQVPLYPQSLAQLTRVQLAALGARYLRRRGRRGCAGGRASSIRCRSTGCRPASSI